MLLAFHKPYGVLSQFTPDHPGQRVLADFGFPPGVYPIGRLDADSEGLLLLSDEKDLVDRLLNPQHGHPRTYHDQVEGIPSEETLARLRKGGIDLRGHRTAPCQVRLLEVAPAHPPRDPPIRVRLSIPDTWIELTLTEGKNRQVRRMTAAIGHPTLRLIRVAIGSFPLSGLPAGSWRELDAAERRRVFGGDGPASLPRG
ncbi:MAG: pseudouridine synthase [Verrucomicrobiales bacterium]